VSEKAFTNELERALARPDIEEVKRILSVYRKWQIADRSSEYLDEYAAVMDSPRDDPELAISFVILAAATYDDPKFVGLMAAGVLEDLLQAPSENMLRRLLDEARKTARIRWMLSIVYLHAIPSSDVRSAIEGAIGDMTGDDPIPPKPWA
jgi:hypothetical protein